MAETNYQARSMGHQNREGASSACRKMAQSPTTLDIAGIIGAAIIGLTLAAIVVYVYTILSV